MRLLSHLTPQNSDTLKQSEKYELEKLENTSDLSFFREL